MTLATAMIVTGVETKMSDVTVTSVVTPMSVVTDECCDYDYFCNSDE